MNSPSRTYIAIDLKKKSALFYQVEAAIGYELYI